jgi:hypothetical protein
MKIPFAAAVLLGTSLAAQAQTSSQAESSPSAPPPNPWHLDLSLTNGFDGNIGHDVEPVRSYGVAPGATLLFENETFAWSYEVALNSYTRTDEWDRISHGLHAVSTRRAGRFRFETSGDATWKGSSEDRELANEFGASERVVFKLTSSTRLVASGVYRYKQYPDEPTTSGPSPYFTAKFDRRFGDSRLTAGYKYQVRLSQDPRDRYRRQAYTADFSTPVDVDGDELAFEVEYRPQTYYQRSIKVGDHRELRRDRRWQVVASYERPITPRVSVVWIAGYETRDSNDPDKLYSAPSLGMTLRYRWW